MNAELYFGLRLGYDRTKYEPLTNMSITPPLYSTETKDYLWLFPLDKLKDVQTIIGHPFDVSSNDLAKLTIFSQKLRESITTDKYKSEGFMSVTVYPKIYQVESVQRKKVVKFNVDKNTVLVAWDIIKKYPLNKKVKTSTVSERICETLGITRFNRNTGTFDFQKFFGSRKDYMMYFYCPIKVLQYYGLIRYHKTGAVEKLKNVWCVQDTI